MRRFLSITCVREQARLLLDRLRLLGDGAAKAGRRRARAEQLEAAALRERQAQSVAFPKGRSLRWLGFGRLEILFLSCNIIVSYYIQCSCYDASVLQSLSL